MPNLRDTTIVSDNPAAASRDGGGQNTTTVRLLGVEYEHLQTEDGGDLYVTRHGTHFSEHLLPHNWLDKHWFETHAQRLRGTSTIYKVVTKRIAGRSIDLVVKWSRVGQDVPVETRVLEDLLNNTEFNSPFEEFALVEEMRSSLCGSPRLRILSHRPLAIYVPPERLQLWQTGRSRSKIHMKICKHRGVEIDILRQYIMIYEWIKGVDAAEAFEQLGIDTAELRALTVRVTEELRDKGFLVADMKPEHIIVRVRNNAEVVVRRGKIAYALVDFEFLQRTPKHEEEIRRVRRADYLLRQRGRFSEEFQAPIPPYLHRVSILGVEYVCGQVVSTGGYLWVVGKDPRLFDYFQPERWRKTPHEELSSTHQVQYTETKDNIHIVWKTSRVGEVPDTDPDNELSRRIVDYGYNSPFEEFSFALDLARQGIPTTFPRAIYMTGTISGPDEYLVDQSRYKSHEHLLTSEGDPILRADHDYIKIWGYWNGPDTHLSEHDGDFYTSIDARNAVAKGILTKDQLKELTKRMHERLAARGYEALGLEPHHLLLSVLSSGKFLRDQDGEMETRLCNFELVRPLHSPARGDAHAACAEEETSSRM